MAYTASAPVLQGQGFSISGFLNGLRDRFEAYRTYRAAYIRALRELESFETRELTELGISAYDIPAVARETARYQVAQ